MKNILFILAASLVLQSCDEPAVSVSGAKAMIAEVPVDPEGFTAEQRNVEKRLTLEKPGATKHLYIVSTFSGDCILYSTVSGKVTSGGKKLMPSDARPAEGSMGSYRLPNGWITSERPNEDGTYGQASEAAQSYLFWFDVRGGYHQHYLLGGQIIHISDVPMSWPKIILNLETASRQ